MRTRQITGEMKRWYRHNEFVSGYVYNDKTKIYPDGTFVTKLIKYFIRHPEYYILYTSAFVYKLDNSEEVANGKHHSRAS